MWEQGGDFPGGPMAKTPRSQSLGSNPGPGTRSQMSQLRVRMPKPKDATTKTWHSQINILKRK